MKEIMNTLKNQGFNGTLFGESLIIENGNNQYAIEALEGRFTVKKLYPFGRELSMKIDEHGIQNMHLTLIKLEGLGRFRC